MQRGNTVNTVKGIPNKANSHGYKKIVIIMLRIAINKAEGATSATNIEFIV